MIRLSQENLAKSALEDMADYAGDSLTQADAISFVREHVDGLRIGNLDVLVIDQDWTSFDGSLNPSLISHIRSQRTIGVMVEYFYPEIEHNIDQLPGGTSLFHRFLSAADSYRRRQFADKIAAEVYQAKKQLVVADMASRLEYELQYCAMLLLQFPLSVTLLQTGNPIIQAIAVPLGSLAIYNVCAQIFRQGLFNKEITLSEYFLPHMEDARRVYVARGISTLAAQYPDSDEHPQLLVVYPLAHCRRIAQYLQDENSLVTISRIIKGNLYRAIPFVDRAVRVYEPTDNHMHIHSKNSLPGWHQVAEIPI